VETFDKRMEVGAACDAAMHVRRGESKRVVDDIAKKFRLSDRYVWSALKLYREVSAERAKRSDASSHSGRRTFVTSRLCHGRMRDGRDRPRSNVTGVRVLKIGSGLELPSLWSAVLVTASLD
jgi:hypothetical protein